MCGIGLTLVAQAIADFINFQTFDGISRDFVSRFDSLDLLFGQFSKTFSDQFLLSNRYTHMYTCMYMWTV